MSRAAFARPDGRSGSYRDWLAETAARWQALSLAEQTVSRDAAIARLAARVEASADGPAVVHLYDEIGFFGVWPSDIVAALSDIKGDVEVRLNSPGGSVFDGLAIYAALKEHPGQVGVVVDGLAASAASFVAMAAAPGKLEMQPNGTMMIHEAWGGCMGPAADMRATADVLDQQTQNIANIYAARGTRSAAEYLGLMAAETWMVGQEAVDLGLADRVRPGKGAGAAPVPVAASLPWQVTITAPRNADKYDQADRDRMASSGEAMPDGSYPIADAEDLDNAIHAVGRGGSDHDAIRAHIIRRAHALGLSERIPDDWNSDGSLKSLAMERHLDAWKALSKTVPADNDSDWGPEIFANLTEALKGAAK